MNLKKINRVLSIIDDIETKKTDLKNSISSIQERSRKDILKYIFEDIVKKNELFRLIGVSEELDFSCDPYKDPLSIKSIIDKTISNIELNNSKKIIYLRVFLNLFAEISDKDREVILQSLSDEGIETLKAKMESLINIFKLKI